MKFNKKIVVLGHFGVGKSSLIRRFVEGVFSEDYRVTIGVQILKKEIQLEHDTITLVIWDIEGTENLAETRSSYLVGSSGFFYVCDLTRPKTFENLAEVKQFLEQNHPKSETIFVGNKVDLVTKPYLRQHKENFNLLDILTSAKENENVDAIFHELAAKMIK